MCRCGVDAEKCALMGARASCASLVVDPVNVFRILMSGVSCVKTFSLSSAFYIGLI